MRHKERDLQIRCANLLDRHKALWCHVPNSLFSNHISAGWHKRQGMKAGVPDILIFEPTKTYHGLAIELKVGKNKPTERQQEWLDDLKARGWRTEVVYNLRDFAGIVSQYLNITITWASSK